MSCTSNQRLCAFMALKKNLNELRFIIFELDFDWESRHKVFYGLFCPKNRGTVLNV